MITHDILNRFTGRVIFTAEIDCKENESASIKLGLAVKVAIKAGANLEGANLARAYLEGANLARANLAGANLARANLARANLAGANLADANLADANLECANLAGANLADAYLADANLADANLECANLAGANLAGANLARAYLEGANLARSNLADANLECANLARAYLEGANLEGAEGLKLQPAQTIILPEGDLIVYKKLVEGIAKLKIPASAKRSNATGRKCRAEYAEVIELPVGVEVGHSKHDNSFQYRVGETVRPDEWNDNWALECSNGIHFFITRTEAENY